MIITHFFPCVIFYSLLSGINPNVTNAIINVESSGNPYAIGGKGDIGLMQIRHKFVPENEKQLLQACTNISRGVKILKNAKKRCKHKIDNTWVICYNLGIKGGSKIKYPKKFRYYKKVTSFLDL